MRFEKPVTVWVDNFLGFAVGEVVPVGYYDRDRGVWVPFENGVVVKLLDTDSDGVVDALDADGDDQPDDLDNDGSFADEVAGLEDSNRYTPEATFWRVAVTHFTPWDWNWPYGPPEDATPPNPEDIPDVENFDDEISTELETLDLADGECGGSPDFSDKDYINSMSKNGAGSFMKTSRFPVRI